MSSSIATGHILVVEDQDNWRLTLKILLESEGYQVSEASTFQEAKGILAHSNFDLAVLDVNLDSTEILNKDGLKLFNIIKASTPFTKVIIFTSNPDAIRGHEDDAVLLSKVLFKGQDFKKHVKDLLQSN